jgi:capsular exopolysaccharide synthesis family protein
VKTAEDVEKVVKLPVLGIVPEFSPEEFRKKGYGYGYSRRGKENPPALPSEKEPPVKSIDLITIVAPKSGFSESYRSIRTAFLLSGATPQLKTIILTSPLPLEGKSASVCNFAVTLAQAGKKVLILDADLRKPRQHRIFGIKNLHGLTNHLTAGEEMKELIKATRVPGVLIVNAGPVPPNPSELLGSEKMAEFIGQTKRHFDFILIDTPPVLAVSDALVLGPLVDGAILVVWSGKTPRDALRSAREKLDMVQVKTLGVIINHQSLKEQGYHYKKYYHAYSHYSEG